MAEAPDPVEIRVVGCLVEKQRTTPDVYPLSLNALRVACNQSTNRDPVVDYDEPTVVEAPAPPGAARLDPARPAGRAAGRASTATCSTRRSELDTGEISLLAVLMLRGVQTPGELKQRSERLHAFDDLAGVHSTLDGLVERGHGRFATRAARARRRSATSSCSAVTAETKPKQKGRPYPLRRKTGSGGWRVNWPTCASRSKGFAERLASRRVPRLFSTRSFS